MTLAPLWSSDVEACVRARASNLDPQKRPDHVQMCTRCVVTNQRPRIVFDEEGVCSACKYAALKRGVTPPGSGVFKFINWEQRAFELRRLLGRHRKTAGYDVIVPCSGGKDSSMVAHRLKHEFAMHPLCVKWAPFMYTDIGRRNFEAFVQSGFDTLICYPNGILHRRLARLAFEYYGDPFQPFVYGQLSWPMTVAYNFGIPLVMYGENGEAEYGGDPGANDKPCWDDKDWNRVYTKGTRVNDLFSIGMELGAFDAEDMRDLSPFYRLPVFEEVRPFPSVEFHWFGYYQRWHPQSNYYYASEHTGFEPNDERSEGTYSKYSSLDDKMDGLHYYMAAVKFGIGRATSDAAHEVRDGDINREEALALVERYDGEFPTRHLHECLKYLGMDREHLEVVIERFRGGGNDC